MAKVRACWFFRWLFSSQDPMVGGGMGNTCRKEILLRRPLSGILFFMIWFAFFFFSVLFCSVPFFAPPVFYIPFAAMSCKWSLKCCWLCIELRRTLRRIQYNVKSCLQLDWTHQQCLPIYPLPSRVNVYICIYVMQLDLFRVASHSVASKSRTLSTPRIASIKGNEHFASWARVRAV